MTLSHVSRCLLLVISAWFMISVSVAADWPHPRGADTDGRGSGGGALAAETVGLESAWRISLGSGYSAIAVADGRVVTQFSAGDGNWAAAFDAGTGAEIWRHETGPILKGLDGSDDGPLASPSIGDGLVFTLDPRGRLAALRLTDGTVAWEKQLKDDLGAEAPHFGFTTTPLVVGDLVLVAGGGDGEAVTALDAKTGTIRWRAGDGGIDYQSPTLLTLAGQSQVVVVTSAGILGLEPAKGTVLWHHPFAEGDRSGSALATAISDDTFLIPLGSGVAAFRVTKADGAWQVTERYRSDALGRSYAQPVQHGDHVYGFRSQILVCMETATGERVWRSRPPGGDGLILIDDQLVIFAARGAVVVADASPEGYNERARFEALGGSSLTWPSFDDGRVFVRNLEEMAAVRVVETRGASTASASDPSDDHAFGRWVAEASAADDPQAMVDALWEKHEQLPIVEGGHVHFLYRGDAEEVAMAGSMFDQGQTEPLNHLAGTDLFYRSLALEPGARWEYRFHADFGNAETDPRNPRTVPTVNGNGTHSELTAPGYEVAADFTEPTAEAKGTIETLSLESKALGETKEIEVYLPAGYASGTKAYPLLLVAGPEWREKGQLTTALDNLIGQRVAPVVVAFVPPTDAWWTEAGGSKTKEYAAMLAHELVPALAKGYRLQDATTARGLLADRYYGLTMAWTGLEHHDVFGHVALFSPTLTQGHGDDLRAKISQKVGPKTHFHLDWNRYDYRHVDRGADYGAEARALADLLKANGYRMTGGEALDSYGWGAWRNRTGAMLEALFPLEP